MVPRLVTAGLWRARALIALSSARRNSLERLAAFRPRQLLVVCYGNIYRSAFVGEYLKTRVTTGVAIRTAGFHEQPGRPCPERHVTMARSHGVDLSRHQSTVVAPSDFDWAEVIVLMDRKNWGRLRRLGVDPGKLVWLGSFAPGQIEIEDPYELGDEQARLILERLARCCDGLASALAHPA